MKINFYNTILCIKRIIIIPLILFSILSNAQNPISGYTYLGLKQTKHFYLSNSALSWENAKIAAQNVGGELAVLDTEIKHQAMVEWLQTAAVSFAWTGGHAYSGTENFYWDNGAPWSYTQWYPGEPNNLFEECVLLQYSTGGWKDCPCNLSLAYVIELPAQIEPEIDVYGNALMILDGDNTPDVADDTDFGVVVVGNSKTHTFTVDNSLGTGELLLNSVSVTGNGNSNFSIGIVPSVIPAGDSAPLEITFTPQATGSFEVKINMSNNDLDEHPFDFRIAGEGVLPGKALAFDGIDDVVQTAGFGIASNDFTVEAWINTDVADQSQYIVTNRTTESTSSGNWFALGISDADVSGGIGQYTFVTGLAGTSSQLKMTSCASAINGAWNHVAVTRKGTTYAMYVNGVREEQVVHPAINLSGTFNFSNIGGCKFQDNNYFEGKIDEVRIWNQARSNEEIRNNLNVSQDCSTFGLKEYYKFDQGYAENDNTTETTLLDCASYPNNGTMYNFDLSEGNSTSNWVSSGSMNIPVPPIPVAVSAYDECFSSDPVDISGGEGWVDIYTQDCGQLIGSINAPEGLDLGTITAQLVVNSEVTVIGTQDGDAIKLLPRAVNISSSNYPNSALLPQNVGFRFFFLETELQQLNNTAAGASGVTNYAPGELSFTHYSGPNQDCDLSNNTMAPHFVEVLSDNTYGPHGGNHYLQFSLGHFSELVAHEPTTAALPIELNYFKGQTINHENLLIWESGLEEDLKGFKIERSTDNENWEVISFVEAYGIPSMYRYTDKYPKAGNNYYRLKMIDNDESFEYSELIVLNYDRNTSFIASDPYPNPTVGSNLNMNVFSEFEQTAAVNIYNNIGQLVRTQDFTLDAGNQNLNIHVGGLSSGIYQVEFLVNDLFAVRNSILIGNK